jgi:signal peptidase II
MSQRRMTMLGVLAAVVVLAADQLSKWWVLNGLDLPAIGNVNVLPVLSLTYVKNQGITFGLLTGLGGWASGLLAAGALAIVAALFVWLRRAHSPVVAVAIGAIAGGAIGNVIDRLRHGWVTDFIHAHAFGWSWYVFNVADAAIVCGVAVLILDSLFSRPPERDPLAGAESRR